MSRRVGLNGYTFASIKGVQARREYYVSMCPLRQIPRMFMFDEEEMPPELRAQRILNKGRIPALADYILQNQDDYVFSALTASIDGKTEFEPLDPEDSDRGALGVLHVSGDAKFIVNDGQHRRAAIEAALRDRPELGDETIAVVFFQDIGLERCQQMFADLNRHAIRPSKSLGVLYDSRDERSQLAKLIALRSPLFRDIVELEKSSLARRSRKLFTLSSIYNATSALLQGRENGSLESDAELATEYWEEVAKHLPHWKQVREGKLKSSQVREKYIHSHAIVLHALGRVGNTLLKDRRINWKKKLTGLESIDWRRSNTKVWEGRALNGGQMKKSQQNVVLTTVAIKNKLKISLTPDEKRAEQALQRGRNGRS